jgi:hypothetical protein
MPFRQRRERKQELQHQSWQLSFFVVFNEVGKSPACSLPYPSLVETKSDPYLPLVYRSTMPLSTTKVKRLPPAVLRFRFKTLLMSLAAIPNTRDAS